MKVLSDLKTDKMNESVGSDRKWPFLPIMTVLVSKMTVLVTLKFAVLIYQNDRSFALKMTYLYDQNDRSIKCTK